MEEDSGSGPLLRNQNSFNLLTTTFLSNLPHKLRSCLDSESPFDSNLHVSTTTNGLSQGEKEYYEGQFATLKSFEEVDSIMTSDSIDVEDIEKQAQHERAMKISNYANAVLLVLKIYVMIRTGSMAVAASTLDSLLDFMAGGILWFTHLAMKNINMYKYPIGKLRMQPVGIIVFAAVMATLGFQY
uniref:Cation efflux protein transmembrane domain-containing protein n=1 Tax=Lotus japonicus TaxID=34305 RepID=I3S369_LOTJA|nr:unknown [Lotus japonicus]